MNSRARRYSGSVGWNSLSAGTLLLDKYAPSRVLAPALVFVNASTPADSSDASALADSSERGRLDTPQNWTSSAWLLLVLSSRIQH